VTENAKPDLAELVERLRHVGLRVDTRQYLAAHQMLLAFAARGTDLQGDLHEFAAHLGPIFCTSAEDQRLFQVEFTAWAKPGRDGRYGRGGEYLRRRTRSWLLTLVVAAAALALVLVPLIHFRPKPTQVVQSAVQPSGPPDTRSVAKAAVPHSPPLIAIGLPKVIGRGEFPTARQEVVTQHWQFSTIGGVGCAAAVFASVWFVRRRRRLFGLRRMAGAENPRLITLDPPAVKMVDLSPAQVLRIATGLRRPRSQAVTSLNLAATIEASARAGGLFTPAYAPRVAAPEYLVLAERRGVEDHARNFMQRWVEQLNDRDVAIDSYDFHADPRVCTDGKTLRRYHLAELLARYHRAVVLIHAETATLFDDFTGKPQAWLESMQGMRACVVLTLTPTYRWGRREKTLIESGLIVLPATPAGLQIAAAMGNEWWQPPQLPTRYAREFPRVIGSESVRWLDRNTPPQETVAALLEQLGRYLGPQAYLWLSACAVYPQISWSITLALLPDVVPPSDTVGCKRAIEEYLPALSRLPWLRHGYMPDWLRNLLIARLPPDKETAVRARLGRWVFDLIESGPGKVKPGHVGLEIARAHAPLDIARAAPKGSPLRDRVFMGFLAGANPDPLTLSLPQGVGDHGPRKRGWLEKILRSARAFAALRPTITSALASLLVGGVVAVGLHHGPPPIVQPLPASALDITQLLGPLARSGAVMAPNGHFLVMNDPVNDTPRTLIWDLQLNKPIAELPTQANVSPLAISPDSWLIAGYEVGAAIHLWDAEGRHIVDFTEDLPPNIYSMTFNPKGNILVLSGPNGITLLSVTGGGSILSQTPPADGARFQKVEYGLRRFPIVGLSANGIEFFTMGRRYTLSPGATIQNTNANGLLAQSPDGRYYATATQGGPANGSKAAIRLFETDSVPADVTLPTSFSGVVNGLAFSPRGEVIAVSSAQDSVQLIDIKAQAAVFGAGTMGSRAETQNRLVAVRFVTGNDPGTTQYEITERTVDFGTAKPAVPATPMTPSAKTAQPTVQPNSQTRPSVRSDKTTRPSNPAAQFTLPNALSSATAIAPASTATESSWSAPPAPPMSTVDQQVKAIVADQFGIKQERVTNNWSFTRSLGSGSLDNVEMLMAMEEKFQLGISDEDAKKILTVQDAIDYINEHLKKEAAEAAKSPVAIERAAFESQFEQTRFTFPQDGRPNNGSRIGPFCCKGYTAEVRRKTGEVVGYIHMDVTDPDQGEVDRAWSVLVNVAVVRDLRLTVAKGETNPSDYLRPASPAIFTGIDTPKSRATVLDAGPLSFTVQVTDGASAAAKNHENGIYLVMSKLRISVVIGRSKLLAPSVAANRFR
jgi:acyl carrier protein